MDEEMDSFQLSFRQLFNVSHGYWWRMWSERIMMRKYKILFSILSLLSLFLSRGGEKSMSTSCYSCSTGIKNRVHYFSMTQGLCCNTVICTEFKCLQVVLYSKLEWMCKKSRQSWIHCNLSHQRPKKGKMQDLKIILSLSYFITIPTIP